MSTQETKTITQMVAERPDVDVTDTWQQCWDILTGVRDRLMERFDLTPHPSSADYAEYTTGEFEGSRIPTRATRSSGSCTRGSATARSRSST